MSRDLAVKALIESERRLKERVKVYQETSSMPIHYCEDYGLNEFLDTIKHHDAPSRCADCYRMRLTAAARHARANGCRIPWSRRRRCSCNDSPGKRKADR